MGRVPAFHNDVVQLIAQKLVDHGLILLAHLDEVRQGAHRLESPGERSFQQLFHGICRVAVLPEQRLERAAAAADGCALRAQSVRAPARFRFGSPRRIPLAAQRSQLRFHAAQAFAR